MTASPRAVVRWLVAPGRRWWTVGAVAAIVAVATFTAVALAPADKELTDQVAAAIARPDPVPHGPIVTSIPPDCGLSLASIDRLVGGASGHETHDGPDGQQCRWDTGYPSFGRYQRTLEIDVEKAHETQPPRSRVYLTAQGFLGELSSGRDRDAGAVRPVTGLATEAVSWHEASGNDGVGSHVVFWEGNLLVHVVYEGDTDSLTERAATRRALSAAAEIARSMELTVDGTPRLGEPTDRSVDTVPRACELLPAHLVRELGETTDGESDESYLFEDGENASGGACDWGYELAVEIESASGSSRGTGEQVAARRYLQLYLAARSSAPEPDVDGAETYAASLHDLGDEAFVEWRRDTSSTGRVVFRVRNVLVRVSVRGLHAEDLSRRDALDAAYRAAVAATREIRG